VDSANSEADVTFTLLFGADLPSGCLCYLCQSKSREYWHFGPPLMLERLINAGKGQTTMSVLYEQ
jgi:hypothetical protein